MTDEQPLRREQLANGLVLEFFDRSNRYFGDYHRVRIEVRIHVPLHAELFGDEAEAEALLLRARQRFGEELVEPRHLERMGVPGAEVEAVRDGLIDAFLRAGSAYLQRPDYARRLLRERLAAGRPLPRLVPR